MLKFFITLGNVFLIKALEFIASSITGNAIASYLNGSRSPAPWGTEARAWGRIKIITEEMIKYIKVHTYLYNGALPILFASFRFF